MKAGNHLRNLQIAREMARCPEPQFGIMFWTDLAPVDILSPAIGKVVMSRLREGVRELENKGFRRHFALNQALEELMKGRLIGPLAKAYWRERFERRNRRVS